MKKHSKTLSDAGERKMIEQGMNVVAVARKLSVLLHTLWKRDTDFDPFFGTATETAAEIAATTA